MLFRSGDAHTQNQFGYIRVYRHLPKKDFCLVGAACDSLGTVSATSHAAEGDKNFT